MNTLFHVLFQRNRLLNKELNIVLKEHNLFASQWSVLYCIHAHGNMSLTEIWKYLNVEAPTVTRSVNRLSELGWLEIDEGKDRRERIVKLSEQAVINFPIIEESVIRFENQFLKRLSYEEQLKLMELLGKMELER